MRTRYAILNENILQALAACPSSPVNIMQYEFSRLANKRMIPYCEAEDNASNKKFGRTNFEQAEVM